MLPRETVMKLSSSPRLKVRYFRGAKGDNERRRSWARQSSGALLYRIPKPGDSGYNQNSIENRGWTRLKTLF